jgi:hypothetical protein
MKKASLFASAAVLALISGATTAAFAQGAGGPFADVPVDHWAYKSVDTLQKAGIVIGYPDGTFGGKRAMTRYEFAVAIARLLEHMPTPPAVDLSDYVKKEDLAAALAPYELKSDADAQAAKEASDVAEIKRLLTEFQTELTTLGVDVDAVKHRMDALEGRVNAIEAEQKRVKVSGTINIMARGNNTFSGSPAVTDEDGFLVGRSLAAGVPHNTLYDAYVLHDVDLGVKARLSDTASAEAVINYGNYLPFLGSISSYSNESTNIGRSGVNGETVNQTESFSVYKAVIDAAARIPLLGGVNVEVGRMPVQFTPYTLKLIDVDSYFYNDKTDLGDIPVDGGKLGFKVGGLSATGIAAKTDPIAFVSDIRGVVGNNTGLGGYGLYAGASKAGFGTGTNGFASSFRPVGSLINPNYGGAGNGAMPVEELGGVRVIGDIGKINIGGTYLALAGDHFNPSTGAVTSTVSNDANFNRVFVFGGDLATHLTPLIGVTGSYTKSNTGGPQLTTTGGGTFVNIGTHSDITNNNDAWEAALTLTPGAFTLIGGYRHVGPYFGAPGFWDKLGSWTNPVDIKGPFVKGKYAITSSLAFEAQGQFYQGTGEALSEGGISTDDKITNASAGFKYALSSPSKIGLGVEETQYKIGEGINSGAKPTEYLVDVGYGYSFTPATSFKVGYQWINFVSDGTGTSFDPNGSQRGGVATTQFSVKF